MQNNKSIIQNMFVCLQQHHFKNPLNFICLQSFCRESPLVCCVCLEKNHKRHKSIEFDKLLKEYEKNLYSLNQPLLNRKVNRQQQILKDHLYNFKLQLFSAFLKFDKNIDRYIINIQKKIQQRKNIIELIKNITHPNQISKITNFQELLSTIQFILNNSIFEDSNSIANFYYLMKQDKSKFYDIVDKMVELTEVHQKTLENILNPIKITYDNQKNDRLSDFTFCLKPKKIIKQLQQIKESHQSRNKYKIQRGRDIINDRQVKLQQSFQTTHTILRPKSSKSQFKDNYLLQKYKRSQSSNKIEINQYTTNMLTHKTQYKFGSKHFMLKTTNDNTTIFSRFSPFDPQFAIIIPQLNKQPYKLKQLRLKIVKCRNKQSKNALGIGISYLNSLQQCKFENFPDNLLMVTSQGQTISTENDYQDVQEYSFNKKNIKHQSNNFTFGTSDILDLKYDSIKNFLTIKCSNGQQITLKALNSLQQSLYICVRLGYATDEVRII